MMGNLFNFTLEEDQIILKFCKKNGLKFAKLAEILPGRSSEMIKLRYHQYLKKKQNKNLRKTDKLVNTIPDKVKMDDVSTDPSKDGSNHTKEDDYYRDKSYELHSIFNCDDDFKNTDEHRQRSSLIVNPGSSLGNDFFEEEQLIRNGFDFSGIGFIPNNCHNYVNSKQNQSSMNNFMSSDLCLLNRLDLGVGYIMNLALQEESSSNILQQNLKNNNNIQLNYQLNVPKKVLDNMDNKNQPISCFSTANNFCNCLTQHHVCSNLNISMHDFMNINTTGESEKLAMFFSDFEDKQNLS